MSKLAVLFGLIIAFVSGFLLNNYLEGDINDFLFPAEVVSVDEGERVYSVNYRSLFSDFTGSFEYFPEDSYLNTEYVVGDKVLVKGGMFQDFLRYQGVILLLMIFIVVVALVAGWQGIYSLLGMVISFVLIFYFLIPEILGGSDALLTVLWVSGLVVVINFLLSHGFKRKTLSAIFGTIAALLLAMLLIFIFQDVNHLTGLASEDELFLIGVADVNFRHLFLVGIVISVLGVLDDVTVAQSSIVQELKNANPSFSKAELLKRSLIVGRDHIASVVNTIVLVYVGASLPLFILFVVYEESLLEIVNLEFMAEEITKILISSIALIMAVPITAVIAVFLLKSGDDEGGVSCHHHH
jgi:uncharacterized membrane protein